MGVFSYICPCGKNIRIDEKVVLKHIRHGEVLGEVTGYYNGYGGVYGERYRGHHAGINGHESIWQSEYKLPDSRYFLEECRVYNGKLVDWVMFCEEKEKENPDQDLDYDLANILFKDLPRPEPTIPRSGSEAWHLYCYERATEKQKEAHIIAAYDPEQGYQTARKRFS